MDTSKSCITTAPVPCHTGGDNYAIQSVLHYSQSITTVNVALQWHRQVPTYGYQSLDSCRSTTIWTAVVHEDFPQAILPVGLFSDGHFFDMMMVVQRFVASCAKNQGRGKKIGEYLKKPC